MTVKIVWHRQEGEIEYNVNGCSILEKRVRFKINNYYFNIPLQQATIIEVRQ